MCKKMAGLLLLIKRTIGLFIPDVKHGKGRMNLRHKDDVDLDVMRQVIKQLMLG